MNQSNNSVTSFVRNINALWIIAYCAIITMAFGLQVFEHEEPCPLCYLQRIAMTLVSITAAMNLLKGVRLYHYSMAIIASLFGGSIAIRQILLHICPGFPKFGVPFWGLSLYTWSFLTFAGSLLVAAILVGLYDQKQKEKRPLNWFQVLALIWLFLVVIGNIASSYIDCGWGACRD